jgi:tetratricopeptide (TPR) repeat protein
MSIIYDVIIETTKKKNRFHITWHNLKTSKVDSFEQESEITREESQRLWQWPRCQLPIGEKLFRFLDGDNRHFQQGLDQAKHLGEPLQIHLRACKQTADWPFELLAKDNTFLLPQGLHLVRTVSDWGIEKMIHPEDRPLKLLFMACSAMDVQPELDFEREEEAIFRITENLPIDMEVEDSGSLEGLRARLEKEHYDVVHLSGHADIDKNGRPYFVMEDETGYQHNVYPHILWDKALIENPPRLLFLSGCRTGEVPDSSDTADTPENTAEGSFARLLVENNKVPAVLGWGRSVSDKEASHASNMIFHELSRGRSILEAVQRARFELIKSFTDTKKPAWPLLRLYSSGMPLNAIVKKGQRILPKHRRMKHVYLKNSQVQVLAEGFVGRRRQLQTSLRALKHDNYKVGLLLLGTGGLGKSCLAGKICERFPDHTLIIVHGRFNTITLESTLNDAFINAQDEKGQQILSQKIEMTDKLSHLCATSFKEKNYLLLLDDFEQNLEGADKGKPGPILAETADLLKVLLHYLPFSGKMTQMIITGRYKFSLTEQNRDMVEDRMEKIWLTSFHEPEQRKKSRQLKNILNYENQSKVPDLLSAGHGNPRLMEWVNVLVGRMATAEVPQLLEAISDKQEKYIQKHVIRELLHCGGDELSHFLRWFSIFRRPVLVEGAQEVGEKAGLENWEELLGRGIGLSLIEHDQARQVYGATPLLRRKLLADLKDLHSCHTVAFAYYKKVCESQDSFDPILVEEWIFHALECGEEEVASRQGGELVMHLRERLALLEAKRVGLWVLDRKKQELSTSHSAFFLMEIGTTICGMGDYRKAMAYYQQAIPIWKSVYGEKHHEVATALNNLGEVWRSLGKPKKAKDYFQQSLSIAEEVLGKMHPKVATRLNNLGLIWQELGEIPKAIDYHKQALNIWKTVYGEKHPQIAEGMNSLGSAFHESGEVRKAIEFYQQALSIDEMVSSGEHPNVAVRLNNLGTAWDDLGNKQKAIKYYQQAHDIDETVFGRGHPKVAIRLNNLGLAWLALGELNTAMDYFQQALAIDEAAFDRKHPNLAFDLNNIGRIWAGLGDNQKAIEYYQQALDIWKGVYGDKHQDVATALSNLGGAWKNLGEYKRAIDYYQQSLSILKAIYGEKHPKVATELNNLGGAWKRLGEIMKAIEYFQQALSIDEVVSGRKHPDVAARLNNLGTAWDDLGNKQKAIEYYQQALSIIKAAYGEKHPQVATIMNNIGVAWQALGKTRKAMKYYQQAISIDKAMLGVEHPEVATDLTNLGRAWQELGEIRKAIEFYQQALDIDEKVFGRGNPDVAIDLNNLGSAYFALGKKEKATDYFEKAYQLYNKFFGPEHPHTKNASKWLKECQ